MLDLGARLGLPGMADEDGRPVYADYADYMARHERRPGVGPLAGWRGKDGNEHGRGAPNPDQIARYIENGGFWSAEIPEEARFFKPWNRDWQDWAVKMGLQDAPLPYVFQLYLEPLARFRLAAEGHGPRVPPESHAARIRENFAPLPFWRPPAADPDFPLHAITQRPAAMYHSWGSQNAWLRQIHGADPLYVPGDLWRELGLEEGDWVFVESAHGRIHVPAARMDAVEAHTLWTWNAIGKRKGAWALHDNAPEARKGFLLNHLIPELLPEKGDGHRWSNSDPITGQAAWFDLRVRIEKAPRAEAVSPDAGAQKSPVGQGPDVVLFGGESR
jgi:anaerobic selenocysteine-containing dehydrogenase